MKYRVQFNISKQNFFFPFLFLLFIFFCNPGFAQNSIDYKANLFFNILQHLELNKSGSKKKFSIGILDPEGATYQAIIGMSGHSPLPTVGIPEIKFFRTTSKLHLCNVVYVVSGNIYNLNEMKAVTKNSSILIFAEDENLFAQGAHFYLFFKSGRWNFKVNRSKLSESQVKANGDLYSIAYFDQVESTLGNPDKKIDKAYPKVTYSVDDYKLKEKIKSYEALISSGKLNSQKEKREFLEQLNLTKLEKDSIIQEIKEIEDKRRITELELEKAELLRKRIEEEARRKTVQIQSQGKENRLYIIIFSTIAGFLTLIAGLLYYSLQKRKKALRIIKKTKEELAEKVEEIMIQNEEIKRQTREIEIKNTEISRYNENIRNSIRAAQTIQEAMLVSNESIKRVIPSSFIFYKPREIVSGDFYWFANLRPKPVYEFKPDEKGKKNLIKGFSEHKIALAAVDCTGHGIPGAFMSMIANTLLNETVYLKNITDPASILNELHLSVRNALKQDESGNLDGMDIAICVICKSNNGEIKLEYAGAKNPLLFVQNGEILELKGNKFSIGGYQKGKERIYNKHTIYIDQPTQVYLFSDGYRDQFGKEGNRFSSENFKKLIYEIHTLPMPMQEQILAETLQKWMGTGDQIDDVLVIGFKLDEQSIIDA